MGKFLKFINYIVIATLFSGGFPADARSGEAGLFGSREIMNTDLSAFKKWNSALLQIKKDFDPSASPQQDCHKTIYRKCYMDDWRNFLNFLKDKPVDWQIAEVNSYMNKSPYVTDIINWHVPDYWESLRQFFTRDGDCEDYAIAKYLSLKQLGFDIDKMRIVVVQDTSLNVPHAVLVVSYNGKRLILDNQIPYVAREKTVLHYRPYYSINEHAWWLYRM